MLEKVSTKLFTNIVWYMCNLFAHILFEFILNHSVFGYYEKEQGCKYINLPTLHRFLVLPCYNSFYRLKFQTSWCFCLIIISIVFEMRRYSANVVETHVIQYIIFLDIKRIYSLWFKTNAISRNINIKWNIKSFNYIAYEV